MAEEGNLAGGTGSPDVIGRVSCGAWEDVVWPSS